MYFTPVQGKIKDCWTSFDHKVAQMLDRKSPSYSIFSSNFIVNPFPHTAIVQQTTFRKILNVHSAEEIAPAGAMSTCIYGVKG